MNYNHNEQEPLTKFLESTCVEVALNDSKFIHKQKSIGVISKKHSKKNIIAGYGRCKACDCKGYISKHNGSHECKTCGHHYDRHYSA